MSKSGLITELEKSKSYDIALFTTFNFEIGFFERFVKNILFSNNINKISVFVDSKELNKSINSEKDVYNIGRHYVVNPVEMNSSFHPKVILLLGEESAKLIVTSANLTTSGYCINNEIYNSFEANSQNLENAALIRDALDFFVHLNEISFNLDSALFNEISHYMEYWRSLSWNASDSRKLIHNIEVSILDRIQHEISGTVTDIQVAVPFFDNSLKALRSLSKAFKSSKIDLFLQNGKCRIPYRDVTIDDKYITIPFSGFHDRKGNHFYHGKVFRFSGEKTYVLYGSANCTSSALCQSFKTGGNIECCILEIDDNHESDAFFDNIKPCSLKEDIDFRMLEYAGDSDFNFFFRHGELESSMITLHFGYNKMINDVQITLNSDNLEFSYVNNELEITIDVGKSPVTRIEIVFEWENSCERVLCWYTDPTELSFRRMVLKRDSRLDEISLDNTNADRYMEDQVVILNNLALCMSEYAELLRFQAMMRKTKSTEEDPDDDYPEDGIIDYVIPPSEFLCEKKRQEKLLSIRHYYHDLFFGKVSKQAHVQKQESIETEPYRTARMPQSSEKKFKRFVNQRLKSFLDLDFVEITSYEHYRDCALVFISIFEKYSVQEHVKSLFDDINTAISKVRILWNLLYLSDSGDRKNMKELLNLTLRIILTNKFCSEISEQDGIRLLSEERNLLYEIDARYNIRKKADKETENISLGIPGLHPKRADDFIDKLFGYLPISRINDIITKEFSGKARVHEKQKEATIICDVETLRGYMKYRSKAIDELVKYNNYYRKWDQIVLRFDLLRNNYNPNLPREVCTVKYLYEVQTDRLYVIYYRKDGTVEKEYFS